MSWWKKCEPAKDYSKEESRERTEIWERVVKDRLIDVQSDIDNINRILNEQQKEINDMFLIVRALQTRNTDAIELKKAVEHLIHLADYKKVRE